MRPLPGLRRLWKGRLGAIALRTIAPYGSCFDAENQLHAELAVAGAEAEKVAAGVALPDDIHFQTARRRVREALAESGVAERIDTLVARLLP